MNDDRLKFYLKEGVFNMNRLIVILSIFVFMFLLIGSQSQSTMARDGGDFLTEGIYPSDPPETQSDGMPGWPVPEEPIPHHEPGHLSHVSHSHHYLRRHFPLRRSDP